MIKRYRNIILIAAIIILGVIFILSRREIPSVITYGASFSKLHSNELNLDWKETYLAILDDLKVKHLRLSAHWTMIESSKGEYNFSEIDYQINEAEKRGADVILSVGLRLPGWPECHTPDWAINYDKNSKNQKILEYITKVVERYKNAPNLRYWQVENESFLRFATQYCEPIDETFLQSEIDLVRKLDPNHKILVTDSGELGKWYKARQYGDVFGTSVYLYVWDNIFGPLRYPITPGFFRFKQNIIDLVSGPKQTILIELAAEPWLTRPIIKAPILLQLERMGIDKFNEIIEFNRKSAFSEQYLWGAEWWYYMKNNGHSEFWERAKKLYESSGVPLEK